MKRRNNLDMVRQGFRRNKRGQFLVLISLGIVIVMVALSSVLAYTAVSPIHFVKTDFREATTQLGINFRQALAIALADVSKELDRKASVKQYLNYTKLDEYPQARDKGYETLTEWQKITLLRQSGLGLNLTVSKPTFQCNWGSPQGYSRAEANMTLDILSYGFYGWKSKVTVELNLTVLSLKEIDGNNTSLYFSLKREFGAPVSGLTASLVKVLFQKAGGQFKTTTVTEIMYFGGGTYLLKYSACMLPILDAFNLLKTYIMDLGNEAFIPPNSPDALCNKVDIVIQQYNDTNLMGAYDKLLHDVRPHLDPSTNQTWVYENVDTSRELALIDDIQSQLTPKIKLILQDPRGIVVGAYSLLMQGEDTMGPETEDIVIDYHSNQQEEEVGCEFVTLNATIRDPLGWSNVVAAEYFIDVQGSNGNGTPMAPLDGIFDSPLETVWAQINVTGWALDNYYIVYVHGKDAKGNWGNFNSITLKVVESLKMHVASINVYWEWSGGKRYVRAAVTIMDSDGNPVEGAKVYGHWSGKTTGSDYGYTDVNGQWITSRKLATYSGTYTFTVDNVEFYSDWIYDKDANVYILYKHGWTYDEDANVETSDSIIG